MAIQVESPAQLSEVSAVFRRRRWWFLVPVLFSLGIGSVVSFLLPEKYEVETQVKLIEVTYDEEEHFRTRGQEGALQRGLELAEAELKEPSRIQRIIDDLGWVDFQELDALGKQEYVDKVQENIEVEVVPKAKDQGSDFVNIKYLDVDPYRAEQFVRRLTSAWVEETFRRDQSQIQQKLAAQRDLRTTLQTAIQELRQRRRDLIDRHQMPFDANQRTRDTREGDHVFRRITEARNTLANLQVDRDVLAEERALVAEELDGLQKFVVESSFTEGTTNDDGRLAAILAQLQAVEAELENMRPQNPRYEELRARRTELRREAQERTGGTSGSEVIERVPNPERIPLEERLAELDRDLKLLDVRMETLLTQIEADERLQGTRNGVALELDSIEEKIELNLARLTAVEGSVAGFEADLEMINQLGPSYEITKEPLAPEDPSAPNLVLVMIGALILGSALGATLLLAREFVVAGFRIPADVASDVTVPILGIVSTITTRRQRLALRVVGGATATATVLFLGLVVWFLWAYQERPELLGTDLVERIEQVQYALR